MSGRQHSLPSKKNESKSEVKHKFWDTQPVRSLDDNTLDLSDLGPIEPPKTDLRETSYGLPPGFNWCLIDLDNDDDLNDLYYLLLNHYVEDNDQFFRFEYTKDFLKWALEVPGYKKNWFVGVKCDDQLLAFISAIPVTLSLYKKDVIPACEVNFLCIHKELRNKRLAPVMIKEITYRANRENVWQALYTAGTYLPTPICECQYYHRPINIQKLVETGFSSYKPNETLEVAAKRLELPDEFTVEGIRKLEKKDIQGVSKIYEYGLKKYNLQVYPVMNMADLEHFLLNREGIIHSYVRVDEKDQVTDFFSFFELPSQVLLPISSHKSLKIAYSYYSIGSSLDRMQIMLNSIIAAKKMKFDVFNALEILDNTDVFKQLKFTAGDGSLKYYLYNYRAPQINPYNLGFILV